MESIKKAWVVVVAAGKGERFSKEYNKVFHQLDGQSILRRCLSALEKSNCFEGAVLVISAQDQAHLEDLTRTEGSLPLVKRVVYGGETRQESVRNGLLATPQDAELVAVHDGARPFVHAELVNDLIRVAQREGAAVPGTPLVDTVKYLDAQGYAVGTPQRDALCAVQTPQVFLRSRLLEAYMRADEDHVTATDDASLYERYVGKVPVVMTPECAQNIKVTTIRDVAAYSPCIGQGYDAHRLVEGRELVLCGVHIPYNRGLAGHSDADVAVHALMDALLGAAALGDIGRHFPDSNPRYEGISSMVLLGEVMQMVKERSLMPASVDVTIVAQQPKLLPYMDKMKENLVQSLTLEENRVNVKATTTEGMGFEGEGLGISAQAVALLVPATTCERRQ